MDLRTNPRCPRCSADMSLRSNRVQENAKGTHAQCRRCQSAQARSYARKKRLLRGEGQVPASALMVTEEILELIVARDRCATHWERAEITERIEALRNKEQVEA